MRKDSSEKLTGNAQFEGYSVDLIYEISRILGFNYTFRLVPDGRYGSYNKKTKEWDGMMKELLDQKADLAIADLTITYDREQAVDFTMPFMNLGERSVWSTIPRRTLLIAWNWFNDRKTLHVMGLIDSWDIWKLHHRMEQDSMVYFLSIEILWKILD